MKNWLNFGSDLSDLLTNKCNNFWGGCTEKLILTLCFFLHTLKKIKLAEITTNSQPWHNHDTVHPLAMCIGVCYWPVMVCVYVIPSLPLPIILRPITCNAMLTNCGTTSQHSHCRHTPTMSSTSSLCSFSHSAYFSTYFAAGILIYYQYSIYRKSSI